MHIVQITSSGSWSKIETKMNIVVDFDEAQHRIEKPQNDKIDTTFKPIFIYHSRYTKKRPTKILPKYSLVLATSDVDFAKEITDFYLNLVMNDEIYCKNDECHVKIEVMSGFIQFSLKTILLQISITKITSCSYLFR